MIDITGIVLETSRLMIRSWTLEDLDDFYEYASVEGVGENAGWLHHTSKEESLKILNHFIEGKHTFALVHKKDQKVIGSIGLEREGDDTCELGYVLSKAYWGQGLMVEACKKVMEYCFQDLLMEYLSVAHFDFNTQSKRVIEKLGFQFFKKSKTTTYYGATYEDTYYRLYNPAFLNLNEFHKQTARINIHKLEDTDFQDFYEIIRIPGILENAGHKAVVNEDEAKEVFHYYLNTMTLGLYSNNKLIGEVKFKPKKEGAYEIGCMLNPICWGRGIMAEAINAICEEFFHMYHDVPYLSAAIFDYNTKSLKMIQKCNFEFWKKGSYFSYEQNQTINETHFIRYQPNKKA